LTRSTAPETRSGHRGSLTPAGGEIEPDTANARLPHGIEIALRGLVVDYGNAAPVAPRAFMPTTSPIIGA